MLMRLFCEVENMTFIFSIACQHFLILNNKYVYLQKQYFRNYFHGNIAGWKVY